MAKDSLSLPPAILCEHEKFLSLPAGDRGSREACWGLRGDPSGPDF